MHARFWWLLWQLFVLAWMVPLGAGVLWFLEHGNRVEGGMATLVFRTMIVSVLAVAACSIVNLWLYFGAKYSGRSGRGVKRGFLWMISLSVIAVLWIRSLYYATGDDFEEHGIFAGWFTYTVLTLSFLAFNLMIVWRRMHLRARYGHRRGSRRRRRSRPET